MHYSPVKSFLLINNISSQCFIKWNDLVSKRVLDPRNKKPGCLLHSRDSKYIIINLCCHIQPTNTWVAYQISLPNWYCSELVKWVVATISTSFSGLLSYGNTNITKCQLIDTRCNKVNTLRNFSGTGSRHLLVSDSLV